MHIHLVDGTYELFRAFYGAPGRKAPDGREVGATRQLMRSLLTLLREGDVTHVGAAFDTVIESFRNQMFDGYKSGGGIEPDLKSQFPLAEQATQLLGIACWGMIDFEADDGIATAAHLCEKLPEVDKVVICTPDKDMAQCVIGDRVVLRDRMRRKTFDEAGVHEKWGVQPASIPDWLALVGDAADGIPGIPRWGAKSAAAVLDHYGSIENIPDDDTAWTLKVRGAKGLATNLKERREDAGLYKRLATLRLDAPIDATLSHLEWKGAQKVALNTFCDELGFSIDSLGAIDKWQD